MSVSEHEGTAQPGDAGPSTKPSKPDPGFSQSIERGLAILSTFKPNRPLLGVSELAREVGLGRSTTHRYVATLSSLGYLEQDPPSRKYRLGPKVIDLGFSAINSMELRSISQPYLQRLSDETGYTANMAILDDTDIIYIERCRSAKKGPSEVELDLHIGSRLPAYCTSMGRVLLAFLPLDQLEQYLARVVLTAHTPRTVSSVEKLRLALRNVRRHGYALVDQEYEIGLRSLAVPVYSPTGRVVATLNLSGSAPRMPVFDMQTRFLPHLRNAATELGAFLR